MASNAGKLKDRTAVRVQKLHRSFSKAGGVLNGLDLDINPGEFVALIGRSGSGKSTLLRALAGLDRDVTGHGVTRTPWTIGSGQRHRPSVRASARPASSPAVVHVLPTGSTIRRGGGAACAAI